MMKLRFLLMAGIAMLLCVSCTEEDPLELDQASIEDPAEGIDATISLETTDFLKSLNFMLDQAELGEMTYPDNSKEEVYLVEGDITMSKSEYQELKAKSGQRQYRTYNLVSSPRTIRVIGFTGGGGNGLTSRMRTALRWAVDNYNALNTGLNFTLTYGTNYQPYDMVVYRVPNGEAGGRAGFPSGGRPYKWIRIYSGMDSYDTNTNEHVITHEMGHAVGLRHTDWFSRQSCNQSGEPANPDGAVHIPGTPTGFDANSVMLSCFGSGEDGEFGFYDRVALEYLY